jgi:hypothetical protein
MLKYFFLLLVYHLSEDQSILLYIIVFKLMEKSNFTSELCMIFSCIMLGRSMTCYYLNFRIKYDLKICVCHKRTVRNNKSSKVAG